MIVIDTGPLVAAADRDDEHRGCTDLLTGLHLAGRQILVPAPVVAEVGHLLGPTRHVAGATGAEPVATGTSARQFVDRFVDRDRPADPTSCQCAK